MLDHMSSSGVMHGDGRRRGEEMVKHEGKKENIAAVHAWYRNNLIGTKLKAWRISPTSVLSYIHKRQESLRVILSYKALRCHLLESTRVIHSHHESLLVK